MIPVFFLSILILLFAIHVVGRVLYCLYFWQIKEYRFDRIKGDLKRSLKVFFPKSSLLMIFVLILAIKPDPQSSYYWGYLVMAVFYLLCTFSLFKLFTKRWKAPKFTKKALALLIICLALLVFLAVIFFKQFFLFMVLAELAIPFATFIIVQIFQIPTNLGKRFIYARAEKKMAEMKGLTVIAINGSYGKSSTKEFLYAILSKKFNVLKTEGNINSEIGVAQTILNDLNKNHQIFIAEMGAYRKGEIKLMCKMTKPKIGIVTGVNEQHMALFGSLENLISAEGGGELASCLATEGMLVANGDNKYCLDLYKKANGKKRLYSESNSKIDADIWTEDIVIQKESISFVSVDKSGELAHFSANVLGKHNIQNLLGAILIAKELGMSFGEISEACKGISQEQGGMVLRDGKHGIGVIDSSYSANPDGVIADLNYLSIYNGKKAVIMPSLIELGKRSSEIHRKIGKKIGKTCGLAVITTKDNFEELKKGAIDVGMQESQVLLCDKPDDIYSIITLFCKSGDTVLLEGRVPKQLKNLLLQ